MTIKPIDLLNAHVDLQLGTYIDHLEVLPSGPKYMSSTRIKDRYWNFAFNVRTDKTGVQQALDEVKTYSKSIDRPNVLYITPDEHTEQLTEMNPTDVISGSAWMTLADTNKMSQPGSKLVIEELETSFPDERFLQVFDNSYGGGTPDSPGYTGLPNEYVEALSNCCPKEGATVRHFLGSNNGEPVAIASIFFKPPYAGLYNVGCIHSARRNRFGSDISIAAVNHAITKGCNTIFLQTIADSSVEEMYKKIGFSRKFIAKVLIF